MSSLVAYESSSDDDEAPRAALTIAQASLEPIINGTDPKARSSVIAPAAGDQSDCDAPMVGPNMPTEHQISDEATDSNHGDATDPSLANLSEQDLVRHLTQASHPMTALPPSPPGSPDPAVEAKFKKFLELKSQGLHFNEDLAKKSSFRNPALLSTLMARAGIDEPAQHASSLPTSVWDPAALPSYAYKEKLARSQQSIRDSELARKKHESKAGTRTIEFHSAPSSQHSMPGFRQK